MASSSDDEPRSSGPSTPTAEDRVMASIASILVAAANETREEPAPVCILEGPVSLFHSSVLPPISFPEYVSRFRKYSHCSSESFLVAFAYVDRLIQRRVVQVTPLTVHRLFLAALLCATKFVDDFFDSNSYFARIGGVPLQEMNALELEFLFLIRFDLVLSPDEFALYYDALQQPDPTEAGILAVCDIDSLASSRASSAPTEASMMSIPSSSSLLLPALIPATAAAAACPTPVSFFSTAVAAAAIAAAAAAAVAAANGPRAALVEQRSYCSSGGSSPAASDITQDPEVSCQCSPHSPALCCSGAASPRPTSATRAVPTSEAALHGLAKDIWMHSLPASARVLVARQVLAS
eukprot:tig00020675_g12672.t1